MEASGAGDDRSGGAERYKERKRVNVEVAVLWVMVTGPCCMSGGSVRP